MSSLSQPQRGEVWVVQLNPTQGGLRASSVILCDAVRSISVERLEEGPWGSVSLATMALVEDRLRRVFGL